jgi:GNAT superfamily N-acetyltransferase
VGSRGQQTLIVETPALDRSMLERFYRSVLQPSFAEAELMTLEEICGAYLGAGAEPGALLLVDGEPIAGLLAETYPSSGVLLIGYLAVHRSYRGRGGGGHLLAEMLQKWQASLQPSLVVAEIDDPRFHHPDDDTGDPGARLRFWDRAGARLLAMPYFQPSLRSGSPRARDMLLIACGAAGDAVPGAIVGGFLTEYFELCEGESALTDPEVLALLDWTSRDAGGVALWPLARFSDLPRFAGAQEQD